jgi:hypothetical protein
MNQLTPNTPDLAELDYPKATKALIKIMNQKMSVFAEADTELAVREDEVSQAQHQDAVALKAAAIAGQPDPGTINSEEAARAVLYQEHVVQHARGEVTKAGAAVRKSIEENKLLVLSQSLEKAELGVLTYREKVLRVQTDYAQALQDRQHSLDGLKMVSRLGLTSELVQFEASFPVGGQLQVPPTREEHLLGVIETLRTIVLGSVTEVAESK